MDSMGTLRRPLLYVGGQAESEQAVTLLSNAGFEVGVRSIAISHPIAVQFGTPVLFGLSGKFEGLEGVRTFIANAQLLGYPARWRDNDRGIQGQSP